MKKAAKVKFDFHIDGGLPKPTFQQFWDGLLLQVAAEMMLNANPAYLAFHQLDTKNAGRVH